MNTSSLFRAATAGLLFVMLGIWLPAAAQQKTIVHPIAVPGPAEGRVGNPAPSPGLDWIAFQLFQGSDSRLFVFNPAAGTSHEIVSMKPVASGNGFEDQGSAGQTIYNAEFSWCPKKIGGKSWFAFVGNGDANNEDIYLGAAENSTALFRLTTDRNIDAEPRWSPDGTMLAFISARGGNGDIYLLRDVPAFLEKLTGGGTGVLKDETLDGASYLQRLTSEPNEEFSPAWSPDGKYIAYTIGRVEPDSSKVYGINAVNIARGDVVTISKLRNMVQSRPAFSPNGKFVALYRSKKKNDATVDLAVVQLRYDGDKLAGAEPLNFGRENRLENINARDLGPQWTEENTIRFINSDFDPSRIYQLTADQFVGKTTTDISITSDKILAVDGTGLRIEQFNPFGDHIILSAQAGDRFNIYSDQEIAIAALTEENKEETKPETKPESETKPEIKPETKPEPEIGQVTRKVSGSIQLRQLSDLPVYLAFAPTFHNPFFNAKGTAMGISLAIGSVVNGDLIEGTWDWSRKTSDHVSEVSVIGANYLHIIPVSMSKAMNNTYIFAGGGPTLLLYKGAKPGIALSGGIGWGPLQLFARFWDNFAVMVSDKTPNYKPSWDGLIYGLGYRF